MKLDAFLCRSSPRLFLSHSSFWITIAISIVHGESCIIKMPTTPKGLQTSLLFLQKYYNERYPFVFSTFFTVEFSSPHIILKQTIRKILMFDTFLTYIPSMVFIFGILLYIAAFAILSLDSNSVQVSNFIYGIYRIVFTVTVFVLLMWHPLVLERKVILKAFNELQKLEITTKRGKNTNYITCFLSSESYIMEMLDPSVRLSVRVPVNKISLEKLRIVIPDVVYVLFGSTSRSSSKMGQIGKVLRVPVIRVHVMTKKQTDLTRVVGQFEISLMQNVLWTHIPDSGHV